MGAADQAGSLNPVFFFLNHCLKSPMFRNFEGKKLQLAEKQILYLPTASRPSSKKGKKKESLSFFSPESLLKI